MYSPIQSYTIDEYHKNFVNLIKKQIDGFTLVIFGLTYFINKFLFFI